MQVYMSAPRVFLSAGGKWPAGFLLAHLLWHAKASAMATKSVSHKLRKEAAPSLADRKRQRCVQGHLRPKACTAAAHVAAPKMMRLPLFWCWVAAWSVLPLALAPGSARLGRSRVQSSRMV